MTRTLRGVWARRGTLLPLLLLTAVVVAGSVAVLGFAEDAGTPAAVAVPLLLLGTIAVPATGRQLAAVRRGEIALARLRGITGGQLYAVLAVEPLLVLLLGALLGSAAGAAVAGLAGRAWSGPGTVAVGVEAVPAVAMIVGVGLAAVLVGMAGALREPLADQVSVAERPRAASTVALFGSVLLLVAAGVAVYRSSVAAGADPGWFVLAGPALVGLAVGQVAVWTIRLVARLAVGWTTASGLAGFLAARRLARMAESATPIRLVVAAAVVAGVSATGALEVGDWADDTARIRAGAPLQVPVDGDVHDALALTRDLDPDGEHLMAAAVVPGEGSVPARRVFLDTARYDAVVGDFLAGTPAAAVARQVSALADSDGAAVAVGDTVEVSTRGVSRRLDGRLTPRVTVAYTDDRGEDRRVALRLAVEPSGAEASVRADVPDCAGGCTVTGLRLGSSPGDEPLPFVVTRLDFAGADLLAAGWRSTTETPLDEPGGPLVVDDGLMVLPEPRTQTAVPGDSGAKAPILATTSASWPDGPPLLDSPGGDERAARVLAYLPALPLVEADGVLADLPLAAAGAPPTVPAAEVLVLAGAGTPSDLLDRLSEAAGQEPRTLDDVAADTVRETGAVQARLYALVAVFCLLVALLVVASTVARLRAAHRHEAAALRVIGVGLPLVRRSGRIELAGLAVGTLVGAVVGGVVGVDLLLGNLSLVTVPLHAVPLTIDVAVLPIATMALAAAAGLALVGGRARRLGAAHGRPATLREEGAA